MRQQIVVALVLALLALTISVKDSAPLLAGGGRPPVTLSFPASTTVNAGDTFTMPISLTMEADSHAISIVTLVLAFDPTVLKVTDFSPTDVLPAVIESSLGTDTAGLTAGIGMNPAAAIKSSTTVATITFQVVGSGGLSTPISFTRAEAYSLSGWDEASENVVGSTIDASITITAPVTSPWPQPTAELLDDVPMGNQIVTQLRTDLEEIRPSGTYYTRFKAVQYTEGADGNENTSASFVLNILPCEQGDFWVVCDRINVGLLTTKDEVRWFVHSQGSEGSQQTIECLRGTRMWEKDGSAGCLGDAGDIVALNTWHGVKFVKQSTGDWEIRVEDENRKSYLVASVTPGGSELAWVETIYQRSTSENIVGGFWHDLPYFKGPYIQEGRKSQMWMWPASDPSGDVQKQNRVFVNEDEFVKTCDPGEGAEYRPDPTYIQHAVKDEIEPGAHGQWYTGKIFGDKEEFICFTVLW